MTSPVPTLPDEEWPAQAADAIVRVVDSVKQKTTVPAHTVAKGLKYGPAALLFGTVIVVALTIAGFRAFERLLILIGDKTGASVLQEPMWIVYVVVGTLFTLVGLRLWGKARL